MPTIIVIHAPGPDRDALVSYLSKGGAMVTVHGAIDGIQPRCSGSGHRSPPAGDTVLVIHEQLLAAGDEESVLDTFRTVLLGGRRTILPRPWTVRVAEPYFLSQIRSEIERVAAWSDPPKPAAPAAGLSDVGSPEPKAFDQGHVFRGLAHALTNPLAAAQGWLQLLSVDLGEGDQRQRAVRQVRIELVRLERFIQALAMIGRRPGGLRAAVDIGAIVRDRIRDLRREGIDVEFQDDPAPLPRVHADPAAVELMMDLLLGSFVEERSRVREAVVAVGRAGAMVELRITESSEAFPPDMDSSDLGLLLRHFRASRALGIALARILVEGRPGGGVAVEPSTVGDRATLIVRIPAREAGSPAEAGG